MAYNISYVYRAIDQFTPVAKKIAKSVNDIKSKLQLSTNSLKGFNEQLLKTSTLAASAKSEIDRTTESTGRLGNAIARVNKLTLSQRLGKIGSAVGSGLSSAGKGIKSAGVNIGMIGAPLGYGVVEMLKASAQMETMTASFAVVLHSKAKGDAMMADLKQLTTHDTNFRIQPLANAARMMLSSGMAQDKIRPTMIKLSDMANGAALPLENMAAIYTKVRNDGRVLRSTMRQLNKTPMQQVMMDFLRLNGKKLTKDDFRRQMTAGHITVDMFERAMNIMTGKGGVYYEKTKTYMKTLAGLWSIVQDSTYIAAASIGDDLSRILDLKDKLKWFADNVGHIADNFHRWSMMHPILAKVIVYFGAFLIIGGPILIFLGMTITAITTLGGAFGFLFGLLRFAGPIFLGCVEGVRLLTGAFWMLDAAAGMSPFFRCLTAITLITSGFLLLKKTVMETWGALDKEPPAWVAKIIDYASVAEGGQKLSASTAVPAGLKDIMGPYPMPSINAGHGKNGTMSGSIVVQATPGTKVVSTTSASKNSDVSLGQNMQ